MEKSPSEAPAYTIQSSYTSETRSNILFAFVVALVELRVAHDNFGNNVLTSAARLDKFDNAIGIMQFHNIYGWHLGFSFREIVQMLGQPAAVWRVN